MTLLYSLRGITGPLHFLSNLAIFFILHVSLSLTSLKPGLWNPRSPSTLQPFASQGNPR